MVNRLLMVQLRMCGQRRRGLRQRFVGRNSYCQLGSRYYYILLLLFCLLFLLYICLLLLFCLLFLLFLTATLRGTATINWAAGIIIYLSVVVILPSISVISYGNSSCVRGANFFYLFACGFWVSIKEVRVCCLC